MLRITSALAISLLLLCAPRAEDGSVRAAEDGFVSRPADDPSLAADAEEQRAELAELRARFAEEQAELLRLRASRATGVVGLTPQTFRPYTGLSAIQLAGTMVVNPSRLETIEVVGAFALDRVAREVGEEAIKAAIDGGRATFAVRGETGELISFDVSRSGLDIEALTQIDNAYFLARSPDVLPSKPDFRAIDWNAPRSVQPEG